MMLSKLDGIHAYQITDRPGVTLFIGVPPGRERPAMWIEQETVFNADGSGSHGYTALLAQFHGESHAVAAINFLDQTIDQINRVIDHYRSQNGDSE